MTILLIADALLIGYTYCLFTYTLSTWQQFFKYIRVILGQNKVTLKRMEKYNSLEILAKF